MLPGIYILGRKNRKQQQYFARLKLSRQIPSSHIISIDKFRIRSSSCSDNATTARNIDKGSVSAPIP
jgi:hypothetical protein